MSFQLGRATFDGLFSLSADGAGLSTSFDIWPTSGTDDEKVAQGAQSRDNLLQLLGRIEPAAWSEDPTTDGWYRVAGLSVDPTEVALRTGQWRAQVDLERMPMHRTAMIEATLLGYDRTASGPGGAADQSWYAIPSAHLGYDADSSSFTSYTRTGADSTSCTMLVPATAADYYSDAYPIWRIAPGGFYSSAPEVQFDGLTVVGAQSTATPTEWTMDNGLMGVGVDTGSNTFTITPSNASAWVTSFALDVGAWTGAAFEVLDPDGFMSAEVIEDTAERCVTRLTHASITFGLVTVDVALRRGSLIVEVYCSSQTARQWAIVQASCTSALNSHTLQSGVTDNVRYLLIGDGSMTQVAASGLQYLSSAATQQRFGVGIQRGTDAGAVAPNRKGDVISQYYASQAVTERVVGAAA